jgi:Flp pilus assembly pilin Flp
MFKRLIKNRLLRDTSAATAIEYGLILGGISLGIIVAAQGLAIGLGSVWDQITTATTTAFGSSSG